MTNCRSTTARRLLSCCAAAALGFAATSGARPFTAEDLVRLQRVSAPVLSPDGKRVAFVLRETRLDDNRGHTDIYVVDLAGGAPRRLAALKDSSRDPQWSAAGDAVYFIGGDGGPAQVFRVAASGGPVQKVTDLGVDVESFALAPTGDRLALALGVFRDCDTVACTRQRLDAIEKAKPRSRLYTQLFIRHWDTWADGRRNVLYTVPLRDGLASGAPVSVSGSLDGDVPGKPFGDSADFSFSPDGKNLVYSVRVAGHAEAWSTNFDLYLSPADGTAPPLNLTEANKAWDAEPRFSPDGRTLAYRAMDRAGFESDRFHVVLRDMASGTSRSLTGNWDRSVSAMRWTADGAALIVQVTERGHEPLYRVDARTGTPTRLTGEGTVEAFDARAGAIVYAHASLTAPADLYALAAKGAPRRLTEVNAAALSGIELGVPEQFSFAGADGATVYGWVVRPAGLAPGQKVPVAFIVHGGPQGTYSNQWGYRWNPQVYAGAGYGAVFIDFHGSTGYGQAFTDSISGDWGGRPLEDLQKGLAAAEQKYPWLDGQRACALGASYGGFMINWIAGNWPDRFRCLVNHDGIFDSRSMAYSTEELWFDEWEHGGPYYAVPAAYEKFSPSQFVARWKAPMLVIHGEQDFRVPLEQGIATFTALQRRGIESKMLVFPDENHWVLKPGNSLTWHRTVLGWLDEHLKR